MEVQTQFGTKYITTSAPVRKEYDGAVYNVPENPGVQVKIFNRDQCTRQKEAQINAAIYGEDFIPGPTPVEIVYRNKRFVGYTFEKEISDEVPALPQPQRSVSSLAVVLAMLGVGLLLSILLCFVIFPLLMVPRLPEEIIYINFKGVPMMVLGWIAMVYVLIKASALGYLAIAIGAVAYIAGAIVAYVIAYLLALVAAVAVELLPVIITVVVILAMIRMIFPSLFRRR